jgi:hypothetical protein
MLDAAPETGRRFAVRTAHPPLAQARRAPHLPGSWERAMDMLIWIALIAAALFALDQLFLWMERRGWLYWRKKKRTGAGGGFLLGPDIFDPGKRYLEEAREERVIGEEEDGDDDGQRKDRVS